MFFKFQSFKQAVHKIKKFLGLSFKFSAVRVEVILDWLRDLSPSPVAHPDDLVSCRHLFQDQKTGKGKKNIAFHIGISCRILTSNL